jgi:hypothetical protein
MYKIGTIPIESSKNKYICACKLIISIALLLHLLLSLPGACNKIASRI